MVAAGSRSEQGAREVAVTVRLPEELHDLVKSKARRDDRSMASAIRHALKLWTAGEIGN